MARSRVAHLDRSGAGGQLVTMSPLKLTYQPHAAVCSCTLVSAFLQRDQ